MLKNICKKKALNFLLCVTIIAIICSTFSVSANDEKNVFYVKEGASGNGTKDSPFGTINEAVEAFGGKDGTVYIYDSYELNKTFNSLSWYGMLTIKGVNSDSVITTPSGFGIQFDGDITFKDIRFDIGQYGHFNPMGTKLIMDGGTGSSFSHMIHCTSTGNSVFSSAYAEFLSGYVSTLHAAGGYCSSYANGCIGDSTILVDGATINSMNISADSYTTSQTGISIGGNLNIIINSGNVKAISYKAQTPPEIMGALNFVFNNGMQPPTKFNYPDTAAKGVYIIKSAAGGTIMPTADAGIFDVKADSGKVALIDGKTVYNGKIALEAGITEVSWTNGEQKKVTSEIIIAENDSFILVNGETVRLDAAVKVNNGEYLVPANVMFDSLGLYYEYDSTSATYTLIKDYNIAKLTVGKNEITVNGSTVQLSIGAQNINNTTYAPAKALAEAFGYTIVQHSNTLEIVSPELWGSCGKDIVWYLDSLGTLLIHTDSYGVMENHVSPSFVPWYSARDKIKSVHIGNGVANIGFYAFFDCTNLKNVSISDSVTTIPYQAFYGCTSLTQIEIPKGVSSISENAFSGCTKLEKYLVANDNEYFTSENGVIFNKNKTTLVRYPAGSTASSYTVPESVTKISDYAFEDCTNLTELVVYENVSSVGAGTFTRCDNLTIHGHNASYIKEYAEKNSVPFISITMIGGECGKNVSWAYKNGVLTISGSGDMYSYDDESMVYVPWRKYRGEITSIIISDGVTSIGDSAFYNCTALESVTIPNSVTYIGAFAFARCSALSSVSLPYGITDINYSTFAYCTSLTSIKIPDSVTSVGVYAFQRCPALTTVHLGRNVTDICSGAFYNCEALSEISIPNKVISIGEYAFCNCNSLTSVTIPDSVEVLGTYAFYNCENLEYAYIGNGLSCITNHTFTDCENLKEVTFGTNIKTIGESAFYNCSELTELTFPDSLEKIGESAFCDCSNITKLNISHNIKSIGKYAFRSCNKLDEIYYNGTNNEWNAILIEKFNDALLSSDIDFSDEMFDTRFYGAQIRTSGKQGLRFIFALPEASAESWTEYGAVVMPKKYLGDNALEVNTVTTLNNKQYKAKKVKAEKIYKKENNYIYYTVCITDIIKENYLSEYVAVPYIIYSDAGGNTVTQYGAETENISVFAVALAASQDKTCDGSVLDYLEETIIVPITKDRFYVRADATGNGTKNNPFGTLNEAIEALNGNDGTVYIYGEISITNFNTPWNGTITFKGMDDTSKLTVKKNAAAVFNGNTIINLPILCGDFGHLNSNGISFVYDPGENVSLGSTAMIHLGTEGSGTFKTSYNEYNSGTTSHVYAAGGYCTNGTKGIEGDITFVQNGGSIGTFYISSDSFQENHVGITIGGNMNVVLNGGKITRFGVKNDNLAPNIHGALNIILNNNMQLPVGAKYPQADGGVYIVRSALGGKVMPTSKIGVFEIMANDGMAAFINGKQVSNGQVTLEEGETKVTWHSLD